MNAYELHLKIINHSFQVDRNKNISILKSLNKINDDTIYDLHLELHSLKLMMPHTFGYAKASVKYINEINQFNPDNIDKESIINHEKIYIDKYYNDLERLNEIIALLKSVEI